jgi:uncharacterized damage-inducible protein DinB
MTLEPKDVLKQYLQSARDTLVWKLDGLSERDQRLPRTPTGMSLLGILKHALNMEVGYFGATFGRVWPTPHELVTFGGADPQVDWYATVEESPASVIELYRRVQAFADQTIDSLALDAVGRVAHWDGAEVTLHEILVHVTVDLQRHAGQADILRELADGTAGLLPSYDNLPQGFDWASYTARLTGIADQF